MKLMKTNGFVLLAICHFTMYKPTFEKKRKVKTQKERHMI